MNIPALTIPNGKVVELSVKLDLAPGHDDPSGYLEVKLVDEGAGYFVEISQEVPGHPIRFNPDQLEALATWVTDTCLVLDQENELPVK